jgi:anti-anti-sigma factor
MNFEIKKHNNFVIIEANVEKLDSQVAPELKASLVDLGKSEYKNVIVNLMNTKYCDSSGLSALLVGNRMVKAVNGAFIICDLQPSVKKMIEISQLHTVLNIREDEPSAVEYVLDLD